MIVFIYPRMSLEAIGLGLHDYNAYISQVANDPDDRACRTKLCAEPVGDIEKLFTMWDRWGWHRVTCYGDIKKPLFALAEAIG